MKIKNNHLLINGGLLALYHDKLEAILLDIADLTEFNGNALYIEEISRYLLFKGKITLKTYRKIQSICEGGSGP
ncbi:hypothetical protein JQC72_14990 [Polycladomyces sp. WAk]|uniref:LAGLIDADG endonuclease n=1 Tax=Polycladomyces zharkentensis TaxID=2807616 RepID=A0ABS2WMQ4_9BACL|nr:hypothetical protein [Polycladomyces sp. WAk]MBN2910804.1 hypothetical protein [Polycladomyces sp. WAk]